MASPYFLVDTIVDQVDREFKMDSPDAYAL